MQKDMWGAGPTEFFYQLDPNAILNNIEALGLKTNSRLLQCASMENRVYEIELDDSSSFYEQNPHLITKFYRPGRWSLEQIQEEHDFLMELKEHEVDVVAPYQIEGKSVFTSKEGIFFALFPRQAGRAMDEWNEETIAIIGRTLGRMHQIGKSKKAKHRLQLDVATYGINNLNFLKNIVPSDFFTPLEQVALQIFAKAEILYKGIALQRVHGDCHQGNILFRDKIFLIDFDDMVIAPSVQDIWMVVPGRDDESKELRMQLLENYETMCDFDYRELRLIEVLRSLRMIHFAAWIGKRYEDEAFKRNFPDYNSPKYWGELIYDLREQLTLIEQEGETAFY